MLLEIAFALWVDSFHAAYRSCIFIIIRIDGHFKFKLQYLSSRSVAHSQLVRVLIFQIAPPNFRYTMANVYLFEAA